MSHRDSHIEVTMAKTDGGRNSDLKKTLIVTVVVKVVVAVAMTLTLKLTKTETEIVSVNDLETVTDIDSDGV